MKSKTKSEHWGIFSFVMGIFAILMIIFITPLIALPFAVFAVVFAIAQRQQKFTIYTKIGLAIGILWLIGFFIITLANLDMDMYLPNSVNCDNLNYEECLEYPNHCELCGETISSSYASCHSTKFCKDIPPE